MRSHRVFPRLNHLGSILFLAATLAPSLWAQAPGTDERARRQQVADALGKRNVAAAQKLLAAAKTAAPEPSVAFEELKACGFYPQETRLECILDIKLPFGFGGPIGSFGSLEFVQMCVDWDGDGAFTAGESVGQGIVQAHDELGNVTPPWQYAVYRDINPPGGFRTSDTGISTTTETKGPTLKARAILSWAVAPTDCNFIPVWGNAVEFRIRLDPIR